jgi:hypothetical protein
MNNGEFLATFRKGSVTFYNKNNCLGKQELIMFDKIKKIL